MEVVQRNNEQIFTWAPVLGICGFSGSGKTSLIEQIALAQTSIGRRICVLKHGTHKFDLDREGKDSYRFFQSGADVQLQNDTELCHRQHSDPSVNIIQVIRRLAPNYDGILLEGHKGINIPHKVWLMHPAESEMPGVPGGFEMVLERDADRFDRTNRLFESIIKSSFEDTALNGAILIGGDSRRYGRPKHLVETDGKTWLERTVEVVKPFVHEIVVVGKGDLPPNCQHLPRLWDVPDMAGPVAGIRSIFRWDPLRSWLVLPCDLVHLNAAAIEWLIARRHMSYRAIMPKLSEKSPLEPLFAYYDYRCGPLFEQVESPQQIASFSGIASPVVPPGLAGAWDNFNQPRKRLES